MPYLFLGLCGLSVAAVYFVMRQRMPLKLKPFKDRERLSIEHIHGQFYSNYEMAKFVELWLEIASSVEVPPELIRPEDRFDGELGPVKGFEVASEMDNLDDALIRRCQECQLNPRDIKIETVDDYIRLFGKQINPKS
jgi:hypothetical protein